MSNIVATGNPGRPWHRRSALWDHEAKIIEMVIAGYSLSQVIRALDLPCSRSWLCRWLQARARRACLSPCSSPPSR